MPLRSACEKDRSLDAPHHSNFDLLKQLTFTFATNPIQKSYNTNQPLRTMERALPRNVSYSLTLFRVNKSDVIPPINQLIHLPRNTIQKGMSTEGGGKTTTLLKTETDEAEQTHKKTFHHK